MDKDTIERLKDMYKTAKKKEEEYSQKFPLNSYNNGYAHGIVVAYREVLIILSAFEHIKMFEE